LAAGSLSKREVGGALWMVRAGEYLEILVVGLAPDISPRPVEV
jgi:hypothetical protein